MENHLIDPEAHIKAVERVRVLTADLTNTQDRVLMLRIELGREFNAYELVNGDPRGTNQQIGELYAMAKVDKARAGEMRRVAKLADRRFGACERGAVDRSTLLPSYTVSVELSKRSTPESAIDEILLLPELSAREAKRIIKEHKDALKSTPEPSGEKEPFYPSDWMNEKLQHLYPTEVALVCIQEFDKFDVSVLDLSSCPMFKLGITVKVLQQEFDRDSIKFIKRLISKHHPDKGGDSVIFDDLTKCWKEVKEHWGM